MAVHNNPVRGRAVYVSDNPLSSIEVDDKEVCGVVYIAAESSGGAWPQKPSQAGNTSHFPPFEHPDPSQQRRRRRRNYIAYGGLGLAVLLAVIVGVSIGHKKRQHAPSAASPNTTAAAPSTAAAAYATVSTTVPFSVWTAISPQDNHSCQSMFGNLEAVRAYTAAIEAAYTEQLTALNATSIIVPNLTCNGVNYQVQQPAAAAAAAVALPLSDGSPIRTRRRLQQQRQSAASSSLEIVTQIEIVQIQRQVPVSDISVSRESPWMIKARRSAEDISKSVMPQILADIFSVTVTTTNLQVLQLPGFIVSTTTTTTAAATSSSSSSGGAPTTTDVTAAVNQTVITTITTDPVTGYAVDTKVTASPAASTSSSSSSSSSSDGGVTDHSTISDQPSTSEPSSSSSNLTAAAAACPSGCDLYNAAAECTNGRCTINECQPGWEDCDSLADNGCEMNVSSYMTDNAHCGGCGRLCELPLICSQGVCTMPDDTGSSSSSQGGVGQPADEPSDTDQQQQQQQPAAAPSGPQSPSSSSSSNTSSNATSVLTPPTSPASQQQQQPTQTGKPATNSTTPAPPTSKPPPTNDTTGSKTTNITTNISADTTSNTSSSSTKPSKPTQGAPGTPPKAPAPAPAAAKPRNATAPAQPPAIKPVAPPAAKPQQPSKPPQQPSQPPAAVDNLEPRPLPMVLPASAPLLYDDLVRITPSDKTLVIDVLSNDNLGSLNPSDITLSLLMQPASGTARVVHGNRTAHPGSADTRPKIEFKPTTTIAPGQSVDLYYTVEVRGDKNMLAPATLTILGAYTRPNPSLLDCSPTSKTVQGEPLEGLSHADDATATIHLPFPVNLYGSEYRLVTISSNGWVSFGSSKASEPCTVIGGWPGAPCLGSGPVLAVFWADLVPDTVITHYVESLGAFIIQWTNVMLSGRNIPVGTFQAYVFANGTLGYVYRDLFGADEALGSGAIIGVRGPSSRHSSFARLLKQEPYSDLGAAIDPHGSWLWAASADLPDYVMTTSAQIRSLNPGLALISHPQIRSSKIQTLDMQGNSDLEQANSPGSFKPWTLDPKQPLPLLVAPDSPARPTLLQPKTRSSPGMGGLVATIAWKMPPHSPAVQQFRLYVATDALFSELLRQPAGNAFDHDISGSTRSVDVALDRRFVGRNVYVLVMACHEDVCSKSCIGLFTLRP